MASFKSYFRWILNSVCSLLGALLAQIASLYIQGIPTVRMRNDVIGAIFSNRDKQEGWGSPAAILAKIRKFKPLLLGAFSI